MRKILRGIVLVVLAILVIAVPLSGCKSAKEKIGEEIGENLTEKYIEGISGGNVDIDIEAGDKWPKDMPKSVPEFKKGKIENSSVLKMSGIWQITISISGVKENDFNDYAGGVAEAGFENVMTSKYHGVLSSSNLHGENILTMTLDTSTDEMMIGYTGD